MTIPQTAQGGPRQDQCGTFTTIGWSGESPQDGRDMAFLVVFSLGDTAEGPEACREATRRFLQSAGLPVGQMLDGTDGRPLPVTLLVEGRQAVLTLPKLMVQYPVRQEWLDAALQRQQVYFMFATKPWPLAQQESAIDEDALRAFVDEEMMTTSAHCLLPVRSLAN